LTRASGSIALNKRGAPAVETACHAAWGSAARDRRHARAPSRQL